MGRCELGSETWDLPDHADLAGRESFSPHLFFVTGAEKAAVLRDVLEGPLDPECLPAQGVRPNGGLPVWLVERAAASLVEAGRRPEGRSNMGGVVEAVTRQGQQG